MALDVKIPVSAVGKGGSSRRALAALLAGPVNSALKNAAATIHHPRIDQRLEARYATDDPAEVVQLCGSLLRVQATVLDVSKSGLRLAVGAPLTRGMRVKITLLEVVIFGEVRYCRRGSTGYHAGILIESVVHSEAQPDKHLHDDDLALYLIGKGLTVPEVIKFSDHLLHCGACRIRLLETRTTMNPVRLHKLQRAAERKHAPPLARG
jgi:hypothetical protein